MTMRRTDGVAIVGFGAAFPGSPDADAFWRMIVEGREAITEPPAGRWLLEPSRAFAPEVARPDRVYTTRGGFLASDALDVDVEGLNVDPALVARLDPCFRLALRTAADAWRSARTDAVDPARVGVIFGHIILPTETTSAMTRATIGRAIEDSLGVSPSEPSDFEPRNAFPAGAPAKLAAEALGLGGVAYTLDAACASSLYALKLACDELLSGRADAMLAGGVSRPDALYTQMGFAQLRALSPRGRPSPFDAEADGLIVGEGAGLFVLKRLEDAVLQGDTILGVIRGAGLSNDVRGDLLAPSSEGQLRAMRSAYEQAGWSPGDVDLIECHATGTPVGDAVELESLRSLWADLPETVDPGRCVIGSVKSNVGHALTAAGAAGLLKVLLAMQNRALPPTANHHGPAPGSPLEGGPFRVLRSAEPWPEATSGRPRRAAISGFGFGGINAHLLIEEWTGRDEETRTAWKSDDEAESAVIVGLAIRAGRETTLDGVAGRLLGGRPSSSSNRIESLAIPLGRFRIPPRELEEMLLQQSALLQTAADAIDDAGGASETNQRSGVIVGLNLDLNTTNFQLRWWLSARAPVWNVERDWGLSEDELEAWVSAACDAVHPALSANRTMGSLGGLVASRVAREFRFGGPSFTVSSDENSGLDALRIAVDWLSRGELDSVVVGAVDLPGDPRATLAARLLADDSDPITTGECAVAMILKRRSDALRDGDRIYATVRATADGLPTLEPALSLEAPRDVIGWTGAAEGLATVAAGALALDRAIVPRSTRHPESYWLRNRDDAPRAVRIRDDNDGLVELVSSDPLSRPIRRPLGADSVALFPIPGDEAERRRRLTELRMLANGLDRPIEAIASAWWATVRNDLGRGPALALIAEDRDALVEIVESLRADLEAGRVPASSSSTFGEVFAPCSDLDGPPNVAFTYPGLGAAYPGMGAELSASWPESLRELEARYATTRDQFVPDVWWTSVEPPPTTDHRPAILGQISVGSMMTALFLNLGVRPTAAVGYSLGESAALVSLGAWADRDDMLRRLQESPLFGDELAGRCTVARRFWELADDEPVDWVAAIVPRSREQVEAAIGDESRVYVLIRNADDEVVVGGRGDALQRVLETLRCPVVPLSTVSTVHCPIGDEVEPAYHALHDLKTTHVPDVTFYSGAWGTAYSPDHGTAAAAITAQAARMIDYPAIVEKAYAQGARVFLEMGPGGGCTRLIGRILKDRPHLAVSADDPDANPILAVLRALGLLISVGVPVNLDAHYGVRTPADDEPSKLPQREIVVERRDPPGRVPAPPVVPRVETPPVFRAVAPPPPHAPAPSSSPTPVPTIMRNPIAPPSSLDPLTQGFLETQQASADAHEVFLRLSRSYSEAMARQASAILGLVAGGDLVVDASSELARAPRPESLPLPPPAPAPPPVPVRRTDVVLDRDQCLEYAIGSIGAVLGPEYAEIDSYPTRVRLPDEPLMLVDRITAVEGNRFALEGGRVVTEHDVLHDGWYLDGGRIATCVAVEAGQADLFLSGWLGIDLITKGLAVYRLLDATVTFHRELPGPGDVIRYDIRITNFFRQGETHLFRFEFDATVNGEMLLTMRDGCAGFFSEKALAAGKGVVPRPLDAAPRPGKRPADWRELAPLPSSPCVLDRRQVDALREGDLATAFGPPFDRLDLAHPLPLPGGLMTLVHRVVSLDLQGGRFGLGQIRAEADVRPDDWFMVCHFVDDRVMPGTLMFECCAHTLRILLMRMGWVGAADRIRYEPLPGAPNRLRCRGQVVETTKVVTYEVTVKELGYGAEPFVIADALMYADGKPIVEINDMAVRLTGTDRGEIESLWERALGSLAAETSAGGGELVYEAPQVLAFSSGKPSDCFGESFRPFDEDRFIARLPRPPYQFQDRTTILEGALGEQREGTTAVAEYQVPPDAWYFDADRQPRMPYAVLIEAVLQSCGFVSAFMGSALLSDGPLKYRNLGGRVRQHRVVDRSSGLLKSTARVTRINRSGGMILHHFDMTVHDREGLVLEGDTYFGFFHPRALADQVGVREASPYILSAEERAGASSFPIPDRAPLPTPHWRMVDRIVALTQTGGPNGLGFVEGEADVDPSAWFFQAHFLGDPVWPGSLGLESLLQLLKVFAEARWGVNARTVFAAPAIGEEHVWTYRGQITPENRLVKTQAWITGVDDDRRRLTADGLLSVDDRVIYQMSGYTLDVLLD